MKKNDLLQVQFVHHVAKKIRYAGGKKVISSMLSVLIVVIQTAERLNHSKKPNMRKMMLLVFLSLNSIMLPY